VVPAAAVLPEVSLLPRPAEPPLPLAVLVPLGTSAPPFVWLGSAPFDPAADGVLPKLLLPGVVALELALEPAAPASGVFITGKVGTPSAKSGLQAALTSATPTSVSQQPPVDTPRLTLLCWHAAEARAKCFCSNAKMKLDVRRAGSACDRRERTQQAFHFGEGVVVHRPNADDTTAFCKPQPLHQRQRVVVTRPDEYAFIRQALRHE
jgi:hypothetical protein